MSYRKVSEVFMYRTRAVAAMVNVVLKRLPTVGGVDGYFPPAKTGNWFAVKTDSVKRIYAFSDETTLSNIVTSNNVVPIDMNKTLAYVRFPSTVTGDEVTVSTTPSDARPILVMSRDTEALSLDVAYEPTAISWQPMGDDEPTASSPQLLRPGR